MRKRMNFHRLAGAKRHSRAGGNLLIYSTNLLRIYSLPPWRNMFFETADNADYADFTQIKFLNAQPSMLRQAQQPKRREQNALNLHGFSLPQKTKNSPHARMREGLENRSLV